MSGENSRAAVGRVAITDLDPEKAALLSKIITAVLSSPRAEDTFAQVIDGIPTISGCTLPLTHFDLPYLSNLNVTRQEMEKRTQPNGDSLKLFQEFRANLRPSDLSIDAKVCYTSKSSLYS